MKTIISRLLFFTLTLLSWDDPFVTAFLVRSKVTINKHEKAGKQALQLTTSPFVWGAAHVIGGTLGTPFVAKAQGWYKKINLPDWTPPNGIFGPVWTILYSSMGVSAARIYQRTQSFASLPMRLWLLHYVCFNIPWASVFFGMKRLRLGLILNFLMLASLAVIIPLFAQLDILSSLLLVPYGFWLLFATKLNAEICKRNPTEKNYNNAMLQDDILKLQKKAAEYAGL